MTDDVPLALACPHVPAEDRSVNFGFVCAWCGANCVVWGEQVVPWWTQKYRMPDE